MSHQGAIEFGKHFRFKSVSGFADGGSTDLLRRLESKQKAVDLALVSAFQLVEQEANDELKGQFALPGKGGFASSIPSDELRISKAIEEPAEARSFFDESV
jgi:hypothetical protein